MKLKNEYMRKILIIDDDTSIRRVLEYNLQEAGYMALVVTDAATGLKLFDEQRPALVITDLKMPGISGFQILAAVKERMPQTPAIVITAFGAVDTAVEAMKLGDYDYITKPFNPGRAQAFTGEGSRDAGFV
jgi:two-component system NtrC family response regulator